MTPSQFRERVNSAVPDLLDRAQSSRANLARRIVACASVCRGFHIDYSSHEYKEQWEKVWHHYNRVKNRWKLTEEEYEGLRIEFLGESNGRSYHFPDAVDQSSKLAMIVINSMMIGGWDNISKTYTVQISDVSQEDIYDDGNLLHLAIRLNAPPFFLDALVRDSFGIAMLTGGFCNYEEHADPPLSIYSRVRRAGFPSNLSRYGYDGLATLTHLSVEYQWCNPLFARYGGWEMMKSLSVYSFRFRRVTDMALDFNLASEALVEAIRYDCTSSIRSAMKNDYVSLVRIGSEEAANEEERREWNDRLEEDVHEVFDMSAVDTETQLSIVERVWCYCNDKETIDPMFELLRDNPNTVIELIHYE